MLTEELSKQVMVAIPVVLIIQRDKKQIGMLKIRDNLLTM